MKRLAACVVMCASAVAHTHARADNTATYDAARAKQDWVLNCMGCHTADGSGIPGKVPPLRESLGHFVSMPAGREFVMRVPGASNSALSDAELANVLNWVLGTMNAHSRPASFVPYTADEIAAHRRPALTDVARTRSKLVKQLQESGVTAVPEHY
jgi:mono/diheme cytochrome c family protein